MISAEEEKSIVEKLRLLDHLYRKLGDGVLKETGNFESERMRKIWSGIKHGENSAKDLISVLWDGMGKEIDMKFSSSETPSGTIKMECTFCPFAEIALKHGFAEVGHALFCMGDYGIVEGFNSAIEFTRGKTLMGGDDCCDHAYRIRGS